jgi:hypothetical protein
MFEYVSYMVVESGTWKLADGSTIEAGRFTAQSGWHTVDFPSYLDSDLEFSTPGSVNPDSQGVPVVFSQIVTT